MMATPNANTATLSLIEHRLREHFLQFDETIQKCITERLPDSSINHLNSYVTYLTRNDTSRLELLIYTAAETVQQQNGGGSNDRLISHDTQALVSIIHILSASNSTDFIFSGSILQHEILL